MSDADWAMGGGTGWSGRHPTPDSHHLHPLLRPHNVVCAAVEMKFSAQDQYIKSNESYTKNEIHSVEDVYNSLS